MGCHISKFHPLKDRSRGTTVSAPKEVMSGDREKGWGRKGILEGFSKPPGTNAAPTSHPHTPGIDFD